MRLFDIAFSSYTGGGNTKLVNYMDSDGFSHWKSKVNNLDEAFGLQTESVVCMAFVDPNDTIRTKMVDPICVGTSPSDLQGNKSNMCADPDNIYCTFQKEMLDWQKELQKVDEDNDPEYGNTKVMERYNEMLPDWSLLHTLRQTAGHAANQSDSHVNSFMFEGSYRTGGPGATNKVIKGNGHLGDSCRGCASVRSGKGMQMPNAAPIQLAHLV